MKVLFLNTSGSGGAFIAAKRIQNNLTSDKISIDFKTQKDYYNEACKLYKIKILLLKSIAFFQQKLYNKSYISFGNIGIIKSKKINNSDYDLIHLHWVNSSFISLNEIKKIKKPIIWTVHDQWLVNGIRHTRNEKSKFFNIEKLNQKRIKRIISKSNIHMVSPSKWLGNQIIEQYDVKVTIIPNPFKPLINHDFLKTEYKSDKKNIAFLHTNTKDFHKGFDILLKALNLLDEKDKPYLHLISNDKVDYPLITRHSFMKNDEQLRLFLYKMDMVCVPSRIDNFPNLCVEAKTYNTPVLAFKIGGIPEIIEHKKDGYLANPFDAKDLINGYRYIISESKELIQNRSNKKNIDYIRQEYLTTYNNAIKNI